MNKLNNHQILQINRHLDQLGTRYYDVKMEVLDHIATSIESKITHESSTFDEVLNNELESWSEERIKKLVSKKKRYLSYSWYKQVGTYMLEFLTWPKAAITLLLFAICFYFFSQADLYQILILRIAQIGYGIYFVGLIYTYYLIYAKSMSYPPPLLTVDVYNQTIVAIPFTLGLMIWAIYEQCAEKFQCIPVYSLTWAGIFSLALALILILSYAFLFVFPQRLKSETFKYYEHLGFTN